MRINRQPIYDGKLNVHAYQPQTDAPHTSSREVFRALVDNFEDLVGGCWALVTVSPEAILAGAYKALPKAHVVIRLAECPEDRHIRTLCNVAAEGYRLAAPVGSDRFYARPGAAEFIHLNLDEASK